MVESQTNEENASRVVEKTKWVKVEWDTPDDDIEIFDFREIETGGGLYQKTEYAVGNANSQPNVLISSIAADSFLN